jgi:hypothetical protein
MKTVQLIAFSILVAVALWFYQRQVKEDRKQEIAESMAKQKEREDAGEWLRKKAQEDREWLEAHERVKAQSR